jgi:hypothetical protein
MRDIAEERPELATRLLGQLAKAVATSFTPASPPALVGNCSEMCALQYFRARSTERAFLSLRQENVVHARDPEAWESTDPMYPLSTAELAVMGIALPDDLPRDWTATEMAAYNADAAQVGLLRQISSPDRAQSNVGAFAMQMADTDKLVRGPRPADVSLVRGPADAEQVRYPHFVQIGDFPICGIPGC